MAARPRQTWGVTESAPYYADGLPAARHTYFQTQVITSRNRVMAFGGYAVNVLAATTPHVDGFDLTAKKWDPAGTWQDSPITHWGVLSVAKDPRTDDVYVGGYGVHAKWTSANATWKTITVGGVSPAWSFEYKGSLVDVNRNEWVQLNGPNLFRIDLTTFVGTKTPVTGAFNTNSDDYEPVVHDLDNDRYLTVKGSTLYAIDPTTYVSTAVCAVPAPENGVQSRLAYFKQLGAVRLSADLRVQRAVHAYEVIRRKRRHTRARPDPSALREVSFRIAKGVRRKSGLVLGRSLGDKPRSLMVRECISWRTTMSMNQAAWLVSKRNPPRLTGCQVIMCRRPLVRNWPPRRSAMHARLRA